MYKIIGDRFRGNKKGISLTVTIMGRYRREVQVINYNDHNDKKMVDVGGLKMPWPKSKTKRIEHYVQC